jgi:hypothetical protein
VKLALGAGSIAAALLCLEAGFRYAAHRENQLLLDVVMRGPVPSTEERAIGLIDLIQLSPNDRIVYELKPGLREIPFKSRPVSTNSHGFRGLEYPVEKGADTVTVLGIGDSVMFGHGVGDGEDFLSVLQRVFSRRWPQKEWRFVNTGVPGYNTVQEVETLLVKGLPFRPDLLIWSIVPNDLSLPTYLGDEQDPLDLSRSFLLDRLRNLGESTERGEEELGFRETEGRDVRLRHSAKVEDGDVPAGYRHLVGWPACLDAFDTLRKTCEERGIPVLAFTTVENDVTDILMERAREAGFLTAALLPDLVAWMRENRNAEMTRTELGAYARSPLVVGPLNAHPSPLQHRMAAEKIFQALEASGLLEQLLEG